MYTMFKYVFCHQIPSRTYNIKGYYLPVCARCTGFYISMFAYIIIAMLIPIQYSSNTTILAIILLIPSTIDGLTQLFKTRESNNHLRLGTGLMGGIGLMILIKTLKFMLI